jgi:hypothetical protein
MDYKLDDRYSSPFKDNIYPLLRTVQTSCYAHPDPDSTCTAEQWIIGFMSITSHSLDIRKEI